MLQLQVLWTDVPLWLTCRVNTLVLFETSQVVVAVVDMFGFRCELNWTVKKWQQEEWGIWDNRDVIFRRPISFLLKFNKEIRDITKYQGCIFSCQSPTVGRLLEDGSFLLFKGILTKSRKCGSCSDVSFPLFSVSLQKFSSWKLTIATIVEFTSLNLKWSGPSSSAV